MSLNAATIEILIAKGLSASDLLEVARATEAKADRTNAARQARHRARKSNAVTVTDDPPNDIYTLTPSSSEPEGSSDDKPARKSKSLSVLVPEWVPAEPWLEFVAHRKAMRNVPFKEAAAKGVLRDLEKLRDEGHCPELLLRKAVTRGWRTVFGDEDTKGYSGGGRTWSAEDRAAYLARLDSDSRLKREPTRPGTGLGP